MLAQGAANPSPRTCARVAAPWGSDRASGTGRRPFRTAQRLADSLRPGTTGCLRSGVYWGGIRISRPMTTLRPFLHERVTVAGRIYVRRQAHATRIVGLRLNGLNRARLPSPTVNANDVVFDRVNVSNRNSAICFVIGSQWGRAQRTVIRDSRIHNCGRLPAANHDHGIYVEAADDTQIIGNVIFANADRGIQLYPDAQRTLIRDNVIDANGEGVLLSGDHGKSAGSTLIEHNVITNSRERANVESFYPPGTPPGRNNVVRHNCLFGGTGGNVDLASGGFEAFDNVVAAPDYADPAASDYTVDPQGPCGRWLALTAQDASRLP